MQLTSKMSNIHKLERVIAYVLSTIGKMQKKKYPEYLTVTEL